jgi:hypothetical protein
MSFFSNNNFIHTVFRHALISLGLVTLTFILGYNAITLAEKKSDEWVENIMIKDPSKALIFPSDFKASDSEKNRLLEQVRTIRGRAQHHFTVMKYFYSRYYMAISVAMILGIIGAVALLFITKDGWGKTNQYVKTVLITAIAITAYLSAFPPVFQQSQNIADNKKLYLQYMALHDEIMSFLPSQENINGEPKKVSEFIHYIDKQLVQLNTFAIGFDDTKVPNYKDTFNFKLTS